uniref:Uncharacterized protein n=1 Tax=viral metagenome TaxID=1070528 RepID=A0A6M3IGZ8_9ZZZZ
MSTDRWVNILECRFKGQKVEYYPTGEGGKFIQYGIDFEEFESGPASYTTAIVEMSDGTVRNIPVRLIQFINKKVNDVSR